MKIVEKVALGINPDGTLIDVWFDYSDGTAEIVMSDIEADTCKDVLDRSELTYFVKGYSKEVALIMIKDRYL